MIIEIKSFCGLAGFENLSVVMSVERAQSEVNMLKFKITSGLLSFLCDAND